MVGTVAEEGELRRRPCQSFGPVAVLLGAVFMPGVSFNITPGQLIMEIEHYYFYVGPSYLVCLKYRRQQWAKAFIIKDFILGNFDTCVPSYESCCCRFFSSGVVLGAEMREQ